MEIRVLGLLALLLLLVALAPATLALYEDQVGLTDWHQQYIGKVKHAVFHTQKAGRKRVVVSTEENVIASLDLRRGAVFWRQVLGSEDVIDNTDIALSKYVITLSKGGRTLRAWNLPDGQMVWESVLHVSTPSKTLLLVPVQVRKEGTNVIFVSSGGFLYALSGSDGELFWSKNFAAESIEIHQIFQSQNGNVINVLGLSRSSKIFTYQLSAGNGNVLIKKSAKLPIEVSGESTLVSDEMLVMLDATKSIIVVVGFQGDGIKIRQIQISELLGNIEGTVEILQSKFSGMFALNFDSFSVLLQVKDSGDLTVVERIKHPGIVGDAILLPGNEQALAVVQQEHSKLQIKIKLDKDLQNDILVESITMNQQRGFIQNVFINNYVRTDRSHGFRALLVMGDGSLLLVQQSEVVWCREDGLASIIDSTTSELPVEKSVTVAKVEHNLMEWLKGHFLKLKATLMLANPEDIAAIQNMRLQNSEKTKMTRDHNGFRKLLIVLTRAGKIYALHTGDGRIIWSHVPSSLRSETCQYPNSLNIYPWQVPHRHALDQNPSVMVIGRCEGSSQAPGMLAVIDSYTGKELSTSHVQHSIMQVMPLPFTNAKEQRLHLVLDFNNYAHLYPRTPDSLTIFTSELPNAYWYSIDAETNTIRGHSLEERCAHDIDDQYCFNTKQLWSIVFPFESEKIIATARRKINEVVHTQAKATGNEDVMYKYISNNVLFVATSAPKGCGYIGSAAPDEAKIVSYLIDTVTGRILYRLTHHGAQGPVHAVFSENWVVYHYFNLRAHKYEMSVIEIYDQTRADVKDVMKLALGKHNLTTPVSSYSWPEIVAKSQSFFFTHSVKAIDVTSTAKGITSKQLLIGTVGDQVLALDKRYLDPRRTANPSQSEREEGIMPLTDSLPIIPQSYVTHSLKVEGLRGIVSIPAKLESTTLIFSYGIDLFFTHFAPSKTYDSLTEEFSYALLLITIVALIAAIFITWIMSERKELNEKWR